LALLLGAALASGLVYLASRLPKPQRADPLPRLWRQYRERLQGAGLQTAAWQGPDTVSRAAAQSFPEAASDLLAIGRIYVQLRYGRRADPQQLRALRRRIRRLRLR
jgi:hypothetical protein